MNIREYPIFQLGKDFQYSQERITLTGKRTKKLVDVGKQKAILKFPPATYNTSEICSEKIAYEIAKFIKIMIFDTPIGEQDRHEDNWGILNNHNTLQISPLYDNGCSLARDLADETKIAEYESGKKDFDTYINRSETLIYKEPEYMIEGASKRYKHFELIDRLILEYPELTKNPLQTVTQLNLQKVANIISRIPPQLLTELHKTYIIYYITTRTQKLIEKYTAHYYSSMTKIEIFYRGRRRECVKEIFENCKNYWGGRIYG